MADAGESRKRPAAAVGSSGQGPAPEADAASLAVARACEPRDPVIVIEVRPLELADADDPEELLAQSARDPEMPRHRYYSLAELMQPHCWGFEFVSPKPEPFRQCCLIPTKAGAELLLRCICSLRPEVVVSLGSGAGLVEWLMAEWLCVICVDSFYKPREGGSADRWVMPQLRQAVLESWSSGGYATGLSFIGVGELAELKAAVADRRVVLFMSWPQLQVQDLRAYATCVGGTLQGLVIAQGENCHPADPAEAAAAAGCRVMGDGVELEVLSEPCAVFTCPH